MIYILTAFFRNGTFSSHYLTRQQKFVDFIVSEYADDSTILVTISRDLPDVSDIALSKFMDWTDANSMHCNTSKYKGLLLHKRGISKVYPINVTQHRAV